MSKKKMHPEPSLRIMKQKREPEFTDSMANLNPSYLHENYNTTMTAYEVCLECNQKGKGLMCACNCYESYYHPQCLKKKLAEKMKDDDANVEERDEYRFVTCSSCDHRIKCKISSKLSCKSCKQLKQFGKKRKCQSFWFLIAILSFVGTLIYFLLLLFGIRPDLYAIHNVERNALLIGLGIILALVFFVMFCCSIDFCIQHECKIQKLYDLKEKTAFNRSNLSRKTKRHQKVHDRMIIQEVE